MVGIYEYANGLVFTGIIAETEQKAWDYLDKKANKEPFRYQGKLLEGLKKANREAYVIKKVIIV